MPPFFVFPRVYFQDWMLKDAPAGSAGTAYPSRWYDSRHMSAVYEAFLACVRCSPASPVLMLLDNHDRHILIPVIEFTTHNGIIKLSFPPHCSHKLIFKTFLCKRCNGTLA